MGHWRLGFSFPFAKAMGYKYSLQTDTDAYPMDKITVDLVKEAKEKNYYLTNKNFKFFEGKGFYMGLPELAQYWITTRLPGMAGTFFTAENASKAGIKGPILKHCIPQDRSGLRTATTDWAGVPGRQGWDAECIAGHFSVFSLDWWFSWEVQDFVQLVLRTGGHIEHRCSSDDSLISDLTLSDTLS